MPAPGQILSVLFAMFVAYLIGFFRGFQEGEESCEEFYHDILRGYTPYVLPGKTKPVQIIPDNEPEEESTDDWE